jgi:hypothetical protein
MLLVGVSIVSLVGYDIYSHPSDAKSIDAATIQVGGESHFRGEFGTLDNLVTIEGQAPVTVEVPFSVADHVVVDMEHHTGTVEIRIKGKTVEESSSGLVMWKAPRDYQPSKDSKF